MKRRLLIAAAFLLAGAVVNVGVAWGCAVWVSLCPTASRIAASPMRDGKWWIAFEVKALGAQRFYWEKGAVSIPDSSGVVDENDLLPPWARRPASGEFFGLHDARGWPCRSMFCEYVYEGSRLETVRALGSIELVPAPAQTFATVVHPRALPLRPIWPGFAFNTLLYAAILWLLIPGPFVLRRLVRRRRGLCPTCGYPMNESAVCSECGKQLPHWAKTAT